MLWTIIIFLLVLGVLVFVHEAGHFFVARWHGIKAEEFGFGFPPRLIGVTWDEEHKRYRWVRSDKREDADPERGLSFKNTIYSLNWIPFGGFVRIKGENGEGKLDPDSFAARKPWPRIQVLAAGVIMNFLLAWVLLSVVLMLGFPGQNTDDTVANASTKIQIERVLPNTPAESIGLRAGDVIQTIDGQPATSANQTSQYIQQHKGQSLTFGIERSDQVIQVQGTPRTEYPQGEGSLGIVLAAVSMVHYPWYEAIWEGGKQTIEMTKMMLVGLGKMVTGGGSLSDVSGPVGIAQYTRQASDLGITYLLFFAAILSINLGIINALPIPAIDGGRILFILIEVVRGKPVSQRVEGWFHQIGFALLLLLMLVVTGMDIVHTGVFTRLFG
ncbi:MAG: RIP metalloprotease RseP [Candidatus Moraniibacteriota bacterium]